MGLPEILIEFKAKAETAIRRSANGIVAMILIENATASYSYSYAADVDTDAFTPANLNFIKMAFAGAPNRVLVECITSESEIDSALAKLKNKKWNYLVIPEVPENSDVPARAAQWVKEQRATKKTFKMVTCGDDLNDEGIINFGTKTVTVSAGGTYNAGTYSARQFTPRIAGLIAGLSMTESATYSVLPEVTGIAESENPDSDIDSGKLILLNDGEKIKVARGINSLHILSGDKTEDMKKIKIVDGMDLMRDDIRITFENNYIGINNSYDNKMLFIAAVNQYFESLARQGVLYDEAENTADIDVEAQREWLASKYDISEYTDDQIRKAKTGSYVFATAHVTFSDAIEDLRFAISME